jgi:hypothetical protein
VTRLAAHLARPLARPALVLALLAGAAPACRPATAPEERVERVERVLTLEVAAARVPCVGLGPRECLQVRERADAPWQLFYDSIEGFAYEPGYLYVLRVSRRPVPNPPADGSSLAYRLIVLVSKTAVSPP